MGLYHECGLRLLDMNIAGLSANRNFRYKLLLIAENQQACNYAESKESLSGPTFCVQRHAEQN